MLQENYLKHTLRKGLITTMNTILLNCKIQVIYFQTKKDELGVAYATSDKRITIAEAEDILLDRKIMFKEILKVKYEDQQIELPITTFEEFIL